MIELVIILNFNCFKFNKHCLHLKGAYLALNKIVLMPEVVKFGVRSGPVGAILLDHVVCDYYAITHLLQRNILFRTNASV